MMSPNIPSVEFRNLRKNEFAQILDLCFKEGRHMGKADELSSWYKFDPSGFFVAVTDRGMFVVKENYRRLGIGTKIWELAINHLGEFRNKGLSAVPTMKAIYHDKAGFKCIAEWNVVLFKLDGKKLLANLADFLKTAQQKPNLLDSNSTSVLSNEFSNSGSNSKENSDEELNCDDFDENDSPNYDEDEDYQIYKSYQNHQKNIHNSFSSPVSYTFRQLNCLKDITNEENVFKDWNQRNKNDDKIQKLNQLINYSTLKPHHLSTIYSTKVFQANKSSPSISLPSLLQNDTFNLVDNNFFNQQISSSPLASNQIGSSNINIVKIVPYQPSWLKKLIDYDRLVSGYNRTKIVKLSVEEANCKTKLAVVGNRVVGWCSIKMGLQNVYMVAPLYANSSEIANRLLVEFVRSMSIEQLAKGLILKLPDCNLNALNLLERLGFEKQDYLSTRCFTNYVHKNKTDAIFAMHSPIFSSE